MWIDYFNDVLDYYRIGQKEGTLPQRLMRPTPASIRDECVAACRIRFLSKDFRTLTAFFKVEADQNKMLRAIAKCDIDRFKPLSYLLKNKIHHTSVLNIELLAWLIDFPHRPFKLGEYKKMPVESLDETQTIQEPEKSETVENPDTIYSIEENKVVVDNREEKKWSEEIEKPGLIIKPIISTRKSYDKRVAAVVMLLLIIASAFIWTQENLFDGRDKPSQKEMISDGGDYVPIKVSSKSPINLSTAPFSRCTGDSPCKACSNCSSCNWCNSGGTCGICATVTKKKVTQKRALQCQATTKKGTQCSRAAKAGTDFCWQHGR